MLNAIGVHRPDLMPQPAVDTDLRNRCWDDKKVDALNVSLRSGTVAKTLEVAPEILLDVDGKGNALNLNIEILGASEKLGKKDSNKVIVGGKSLPIPAFV